MSRTTAPAVEPDDGVAPATGAPLRGAGRGRLGGVGALLALALVATVAMLRPGWSSALDDLPANTGDPAFIVWILSWGARAAVTDPLGYFDANIFWPHPDTLAYSETMVPIVPIYGLAHLVTGNWVLALNLTQHALVLLNLATTFALTRWLTGRRAAALVAAMAFGFGGYVMAHLGHVQLWTLGTLPLAFLLLFSLLERPRTGVAVALGVANAAVVLGAVYYGAIWAVCAGVVVIGHVVATRAAPSRPLVRALAVTVGVTLVLVVPMLAPYVALQRDDNFRRSLDDSGALDLVDLVSPPIGTVVWDGILDPGDRGDEHRLWPGASVLALAGVGGVALRRRRHGLPRSPATDPHHTALLPVRPDRRRYLGLLLVAAAVALLLAAGPSIAGLPGPFRLLFHHVPGFSGIRVPARFAVVALLALSVVAGVGAVALAARLRTPRARVALVAALIVVIGLDLAVELPSATLPDGDDVLAVYEELADRPDGVVVELPMVPPGAAADVYPYVEAPRMVYGTIDWNPRVNGYSGFLPEGYEQDAELLNTFPAPTALARAGELGVRYVILHVGGEAGQPAFDDAQAAAVVDALPAGAVAERHGAAWLIDLAP